MKNSVNQKNPITFRHWTNKKYSVFNSIRKVIRIAGLSLCSLLTISYAHAQVLEESKDSLKIIELDEVDIASDELPFVFSQETRVINVIQQKEIRQSGASNLEELLDKLGGVDIRTRGTEGIQSDISIRGGSFDQSLILLNGIPISNPQSGHLSFDLPVDLSAIERIEIISGPASRIYGPNAFSGAINIVTGTSLEGSELGLEFGSFFTQKYFGKSMLKLKNTNHFISGSYQSSDGYTDNTDFNKSNLYYRGTYKRKRLKVNLQLGASQKDYGAQAFYSSKYPNEFEKNKRLISSLEIEFGKKIHHMLRFSKQVNFDEFILFRDQPDLYHNFHRTDLNIFHYQSSLQTKAGRTMLGVNFTHDHILSNNLGREMEIPVSVPFNKDYSYTKSAGRDYLSAYADQYFQWKSIDVSTGLMFNKYFENSEQGFFPGFEMGWKATPWLRLTTGLNYSMRLPSYTEMYYTGPDNIGNPNLSPEKAKSIEAGFVLNKDHISASASIYQRNGKDIIDWFWNEENEIWESENIIQLNTFGISSNAGLKIDKQILSRFFLSKINLSYAFIQQNEQNNDEQTKYALNPVRHQFSIEIHQELPGTIKLAWLVNYQDRAGKYLLYTSDPEDYQEESYKAFTLLGLKISKSFHHFKTSIKISNLFDVQYIDFGNIYQPGRWFTLGVSYHIN